MLKLEKITKKYVTSGMEVDALKKVDLEFRKNEFVSILGQSGCGKTTLLNIIGGLDRYTSGDLMINGKSTKEFKDKDWDSYRNHSVGFVFQSYNLISHQSVLANVELALTISGIGKAERKQRAIKALEDVGLKDHINKKPNQLSGGQMQRVAIARALVNDPEIILADEPTGALDTKTSVQVMEILKEIAKKKLIIMVTHNPELAQEYSTRIVKILDGEIIGDSNPYSSETEEGKENKEDKKETLKLGKTSMNFFTALNLSLNNLMTKKGRTILTAFAGSIGIIGIALILAISTGVQNYIDSVEEDTLSSYPVTVEESAIDMGSMMQSFMGNLGEEEVEKDENTLYSADIMGEMLNTLSGTVSSNNLEELKKHIENSDNQISENSNAIKYDYDMNINIYREVENEIVQVNPSTVLESVGMNSTTPDTESGSPMETMTAASPMMSMTATNTDVWTELLDNEELLQSQNELLAGSWPTKYNEVVIITNDENEITDYVLYSMGLKNSAELEEIWENVQAGNEPEDIEQSKYTYDELLGITFKLVLNTDLYAKENNLWIDKSENQEFKNQVIKDAEEIKVVGIIKPKEESMSSTAGMVGYLTDLKEHVITKTNESEIVKEQVQNPEINILTGLEYPTEEEMQNNYTQELTQEQRMAMAQLSAEEISKMMEAYTSNSSATYENTMKTLGAVDINKPSAISIYPKDFDAKDNIVAEIEKYNQMQRDNGKEENVITYTDMIALMMNSVNQIVDTISLVLIAFVAISLVVSSIMIGIITYISVLERTKEIGILRAVGASKKDISRVFNAETFIVGAISGLLGILITIGLTFPINAITYIITGVEVQTMLPLTAAAILVGISILLTVFAGLIPSSFASKKDPVEALRTE